jgi:hypothetical protein
LAYFDNCRILNNNQLKGHIPEFLGEMEILNTL